MAESEQSTAQQAAGRVQDMAGQAQEQAREATEQARGRLAEQVDRRSTQAGEQVRSTAGDVRTVAEELRKQGKDAPARFAEQAADRVERVGGYLEESDADRMLRDVEAFGRRNPWALALGGAALGFAAARFLKASSEERYRASFERAEPSGNGRAMGTAAPPPAAAATPPSTVPASPPSAAAPHRVTPGGAQPATPAEGERHGDL